MESTFKIDGIAFMTSAVKCAEIKNKDDEYPILVITFLDGTTVTASGYWEIDKFRELAEMFGLL